ncbi:unnamed protein product [Zymoseptoria tritici ST99CH_3D1]|nr:unnamed protein product [Zymoseptoria tritici ST99CH_3D1]
MRLLSNCKAPSTPSTRVNDRSASGATAAASGNLEDKGNRDYNKDASLSEVSDTEESSKDEEEDDVIYSPAVRRGRRRGSSNNSRASSSRVLKSKSPRKGGSALRLAKETHAKVARKAARQEQRAYYNKQRRAIRLANKRNRSRSGGVSVPAAQGSRTGTASNDFIRNRSVNRITFNKNTLLGSLEGTPTRDNRSRQPLAEIDPAIISSALPNSGTKQDRLRRQIADN